MPDSNINLKDFLKGTSLNILKYQQFFDTIQEVLFELRQEKADRLVNKKSMTSADIDDIEDFIYSTGFSLPVFDGYTSSNEYIRCRGKNIISEIRRRNSDYCYQSVGRCFFSIIELMNVQKQGSSFFVPISYYSGSPNFLDQESDLIQYYVGSNPVPNPPPSSGLPAIWLDMQSGELPLSQMFYFLDQDETSLGITNIIALFYRFVKAENSLQFWSYETANAFYTTIEQFKRKNTIFRYTPRLMINLKSDNTLTTQTYPIYSDVTTYASQRSILITGALTDVTYLKIGNGTYTTIDLSLTDVASVLQTYVALNNEYETVTQTISSFIARRIYDEFTPLEDTGSNTIMTITEIGLFNASNVMVAYSTFPEINFDERMLSAFDWQFNIITP